MFSTPLLLTVLVLGAAAPKDAAPTLKLTGGSFEVVGLPAADIDRLKKADLSADKWQEVFAVYVLGEQTAVAKDQPAILGTYRVEENVVRFTPRFAVVAGVRHRAVFRLARLPGATGGDEVQADFTVPRAKPVAAAEVTRVYPSRDQLPENQLKFYLHFSTPMSRGEAYSNIRLLDEKGKAIEAPFLELSEELWDPQGKRFTLLFDPGRIKRGLKPREEQGPSLIEGKTYTLVIDRKWTDAEGNPLKDSFRKTFRVLAPDNTPPDPKNWKLEAPAAGGTTPLKVTFPKPLDHALLQRLLWVTDAEGKRVAGSVEVSEEETRWQFTPEKPWKAGDFDLVVDTSLEDLAGNTIGRPFEVDVFEKIDREVKPATVKKSFRISSAR